MDGKPFEGFTVIASSRSQIAAEAGYVDQTCSQKRDGQERVHRGLQERSKEPLKIRTPNMSETQRRVPRFVFFGIHISLTGGGAILGRATAAAWPAPQPQRSRLAKARDC